MVRVEIYYFLTQFALLLCVDIASLEIDVQQKMSCSVFKHFVFSVSCLLMAIEIFLSYIMLVAFTAYLKSGGLGVGGAGTLNKYIMQLKFLIVFNLKNFLDWCVDEMLSLTFVF